MTALIAPLLALLIGGGLCRLLLALAGPVTHGLCYTILVAAVLPFAVMNAPPARMFMGDCGAVPLGYLAVLCGVAESTAGTWPLWFPALVFLPFAADATVTLLRRLWR